MRKTEMLLVAGLAAVLAVGPAVAQDRGHGGARGNAGAHTSARSAAPQSRGNASSMRGNSTGSFGRASANGIQSNAMRSAQTSQARGNWRGRQDRGGNGFGAGFATGAYVGSGYAYGGYAPYGYDNGYDSGYAAYGYDDSGYGADNGYNNGAYAAAPVTSDGQDDAYCAQQFKSYDPQSGTYLGYDGMRHPCP